MASPCCRALSWQDYLAAGSLVQILPDWHAPDIWLTLYHPPYESLPMRVATFSDFFERHVTSTSLLSGGGNLGAPRS